MFVFTTFILHSSKFHGNLKLAFSLKEWQSVLKLAVLYEIKASAIKKMTPLLTNSPSLQIYFAKAYDIEEWLAPGFFRLAKRARPLDWDDVKLTGIPDALENLYPTREENLMQHI
ncbi:hypothetical protein AX15_001878 [Amanita polypyramis BW_CC]|nr:hypothetical protein AX15_001878 [Amanita polypyramis BW_CC]